MQNVICITGRIARDPELRRTGSGKAVTSFSVACERDFADKQTGKKEVDFIDCVAWGGTAETIEKYFSKGRMINLTGRLQNRDWTDKNGQKRRAAEILVGSVYFCDSNKNGAQSHGEPDAGYTQQYATQEPATDFRMLDGDDDQLPF
jgi:single-strand DNA-binding protein